MAMQTLTQRFANPHASWRFGARCCPGRRRSQRALIAVGLYMAFFTAPPDYQQGHTAKIMYVHVPAAWLSMFGYALIAALELRPAGLPPSAGRRFRQGCSADRRGVHISLPRHRLAVGQAHVGRVLGLGPAADLGAHPVLPLSRPDRAALLDRGRATGRQSDRRPGRRRHRDPAGHQVLGGLEQPAPAGERHRASACRPSIHRSCGRCW